MTPVNMQTTTVNAAGQFPIKTVDNYSGFRVLVLADLFKQTAEILVSTETPADELLAEGYRAMSEENLELANAYLPLVLETWPEWE